MAKHTVPVGNWHTALAALIREAASGDEIVVHNEAQRELAQRAKARMCPEKTLTFSIEE
jgi:hypothetical protein